MRWWLVCALAGACGPALTEEAPDGGGGGGSHDETAPDARSCGTQTVPIVVDEIVTPPDVLLVVDRSLSMDDPLDPLYEYTSKWDVMREAVQRIVEAEDDSIYFGLSLFPADGQCAAGEITVGIGPAHAAMIVDRLFQVNPSGGTPSHTTLQAARDYFADREENPNGRFVVLATDGVPTCGSFFDGYTTEETLDAIGSLAEMGIPTYVIGFGSSDVADPDTLQAMAAAGGTEEYYRATSASDLAGSLGEISRDVAPPSCTYELSTPPEDETLMSVNFDGVPVGRTSSHENGWDYDPATNSITLYGSACRQVQTGGVDAVGIEYGCPGPVLD